MEQIGQVLHEMVEAAREARSRLKAGARPPASAEERMGLALLPGARVLDLVTGQEGEVISGTRANYVVPTTRG
jgi:hypothetical protein